MISNFRLSELVINVRIVENQCCKWLTRPPTRFRASNIVTCKPCWRRTSAHLRPANPPPTMHTCDFRPFWRIWRSMSGCGLGIELPFGEWREAARSCCMRDIASADIRRFSVDWSDFFLHSTVIFDTGTRFETSERRLETLVLRDLVLRWDTKYGRVIAQDYSRDEWKGNEYKEVG